MMKRKNHMLSKNAQKIQNTLFAHGLTLQVLELASSTRTAQEAAHSIGCKVGQIAKSLLFKTTKTNKPILIIASGINRVNEKIIAQHIGEEIIKADADFTRNVTGFAIGGIPPIGHAQQVETFIDQDLLHYVNIWAAAGTPHAVFTIPSQKLVSLTHGTVIAIK